MKKKISKRWTPSNWTSFRPFGIGFQRPNNYAEIWRALKENRSELPFAWRILTRGVCDGCALGTTGIHDWTLDGVHLCNIRLRLLRLNTMPALDLAIFDEPERLAEMSSAELRELGRLPFPIIHRKGDTGFQRISWDKALQSVAGRIVGTDPKRVACYMTSRGMPNEAYYCVQKAMRAMGSNNIDNAARVCHSPSTAALKEGVGAAATTCSYSDWLSSDLIVFFGSNVANNQPVATKYLHYAKKNGARVVVVNGYREPGMENYWIPSVIESALFGTKIADRFFIINTGADIAFINGAIKHMIENDLLDAHFVESHTINFGELERVVRDLSWDDIVEASGVSRDEIGEFAELVGRARKAVFVWSMGITQHMHGVDNVRAIVNLALTRGFVGREGCGLMPIRGHSGVQGGAEMGAYATVFPGWRAIKGETAGELATLWGFTPPMEPGLTAPEMIDAAHRDALDVLISIGGNFLEVLPEPAYVDAALRRIPMRVHMDIVLSPQMFVESGGDVVLLPATTRYETPGGVTQTSTERRVMFSPEIPGRRIGEARPEWEVLLELARRVRPDLRQQLSFADTHAVRDEIARVIPQYDGIQALRKAGDQFQYGGPHLCADWKFNTPSGKARFTPVALPVAEVPEGHFILSTRRGKQFNSMVHERRDAITGAGRNAVFMNASDAARLGMLEGDAVILRNNGRAFAGEVYLAPVKPGNLQVHWPEGNVLLDKDRREPNAGVPDYNAFVRIEKA